MSEFVNRVSSDLNKRTLKVIDERVKANGEISKFDGIKVDDKIFSTHIFKCDKHKEQIWITTTTPSTGIMILITTAK